MTKAVRFHELGGPEVLRLEHVAIGEPGPGEVLVRVEAIGLNRSEANFRRGAYPLDLPRQLPSGLGYEAAGEVEAVGEGVLGVRVGEPVSVLPMFPQSRYPVYGERAIVPGEAVVPRPPGVSAVEAAAVWMPYVTAYGALVEIARMRPGDHVVLTAASSSVGLAAIQVAAALGGVPIATTTSASKREALFAAGATDVVVTGEEDLAERLLDLTGGRGADWALDAVAGPAIQTLAHGMAPDSTIFVHGALSGAATPLPLDDMRPVSVRPYTMLEITGDPERLHRAKRFIAAGLRTGALRPTIDRTFPLEDVVEAHRHLESGRQVGKIVLTVGQG